MLLLLFKYDDDVVVPVVPVPVPDLEGGASADRLPKVLYRFAFDELCSAADMSFA